MTSVTHKKRTLRELIVKKVSEEIDGADDPAQKARDVALGAVDRLAGKMTLKELEGWHMALYLREKFRNSPK